MRTGHSRQWMAGLLFLLLALGGLILLSDDARVVLSPEEQAPAQTPAQAASTRREAAAATFLAELESRLAGEGRREVAALAAAGNHQAKAELRRIHANVGAIGIRDLSLRYVNEDDPFPRGGGWDADVQVTWRVAGFDPSVNGTVVPFTFTGAHEKIAFVSVGSRAAGAVPLWLLEKVTVERSRRSLVLAPDRQTAGGYLRLAKRAARDVEKVLPRWRGKLVVEVPESVESLEQVLGAEDGSYRSIAAVTSTLDGSVNRLSPSRIMVNRAVFGQLGGRGAQVVMSHEAAHVATNAATSTLPMWLVEGFADYVALAHLDLPVSATASQILDEVRKNGPPEHLPADQQFHPENKLLGPSYEAAWLACRLLAERHGERQLVDFYRAVDDGLGVDAAFRRFFDTGPLQFTRQWQDYLRRLAD